MDQRDEARVAELEAWLEARWVDPGGLDVERLKCRTRLAAQEEWLARQLASDADAAPSPAALHHVRWRVREALRESPAARRRPVAALRGNRVFARRRWLLGAGALAAACLVVAIGIRSLRPDDMELPMLAAFDEYEPDDWESSLVALASDLDGIEQRLFQKAEADTGDDGLKTFLEILNDVEDPGPGGSL